MGNLVFKALISLFLLSLFPRSFRFNNVMDTGLLTLNKINNFGIGIANNEVIQQLCIGLNNRCARTTPTVYLYKLIYEFLEHCKTIRCILQQL